MSEKYNKIGITYNSTRKADTYLTERLFFLLRPQTNKLYLDIGCGTGNYTTALAEKGFKFIGVEPSDEMLFNVNFENKNVSWKKGTEECVPASDDTFDGAIATLTIHHWKNIKKAFGEINRVLLSKGRIVIFTATPEQMSRYWLNHYFPKMMDFSIAQMPSQFLVETSAAQFGLRITHLEKYFINKNLQDCFLYIGKNNPEFYFDKKVRDGISSFSSLTNKKEVQSGLLKLRADIDNGIFEKIKDTYKNDLGDYMFMVLEKN